jgi:hypothetical protein
MILTFANPKDEGAGRNAVKRSKSALIVAVTRIARKKAPKRAEPANSTPQPRTGAAKGLVGELSGAGCGGRDDVVHVGEHEGNL